MKIWKISLEIHIHTAISIFSWSPPKGQDQTEYLQIMKQYLMDKGKYFILQLSRSQKLTLIHILDWTYESLTWLKRVLANIKIVTVDFVIKITKTLIPARWYHIYYVSQIISLMRFFLIHSRLLLIVFCLRSGRV